MTKLALQEAVADPDPRVKIETAKDFKRRLRAAKIGDVIVYHATHDGIRHDEVFAAARQAFDSGKVILYQRRNYVEVPGDVIPTWEHCAQRCSDRASGWIDRVSALTEAPYNPQAAPGYERDDTAEEAV